MLYMDRIWYLFVTMYGMNFYMWPNMIYIYEETK